ncbi:TPA: DUF1294 domain-containing protein [Streptococcus suis]|uniref:DUF1294 domain-containing protein n=1 Tax=Streptococcus TaxID=1301 RepID=UPI000CF4A107|nr:DUF1294 domain-containing protein [Streptococcus suis]MDW8743593.1 DUF1294 domain-containing protein [Streptococcus suis]NJW39099.1 DUF1294 domain-containing protein [Streptococcus suis]NQG19648.1 DUF1294 domain-containing protein [Streptococcus suis]NQH33083.1 DUF1294 domain-containing protein [Streptococcus suis]NQH96187.1 DUF1294 domain-containing protein [Streptococcus suis]
MDSKQVVAMLLLVWNLVVFLTYGMDKGKARKGAYRISEKTLLLMSYLGGGLGAWAGGNRFRHKTQKWYFKLAWTVGVLIDLAILLWVMK